MTLARSKPAPLPIVWLVTVALMSGGCGDDDGPSGAPDGAADAAPSCDVAEVRARLVDAAATPGAVVELGACTYEGPLEVPPGVTLRGRGSDQTTLASGADVPAIALLPGAGSSRVESLALRVDGHVGVLAEGEGAVAIRDVRVTVERGIGIAVGGRASLVLEDVEVASTTDRAALGDLAPGVERREAPTYGLVVLDVGDVTLTRVSARAFAHGGVVVVRSPLVWTEGGVADSRGVGIGVWASTARLENVRVEGTVRGRVLSTMAMLAADGAALTTLGCALDANDSIGLLHDASTGVHDSLDVQGSRGPAVWTQRSASLRVEGSTLRDNRIAGVIAIDSSGVQVVDTAIEGTELGVPPGDFGDREPTGDGVHVIRDDGGALDVVLDRVTLVGNVRVGVMLDAAGGAFGTSRLAGVSVDGSGEALGAVAQRIVDLPVGWDDSVERLGVTAANDERFADLLSAVGIVMPPELPAGLEDGMLSTLLGP